MCTTPDIGSLHQRVVETNAQLHRSGDLAPSERLEQMIQLRQALRDLCLASGAWDADMETLHEAEMAALRKLLRQAGTAAAA